MNIEELTIKQVNELKKFFALDSNEKNDQKGLNNFLSKYVICRTRNEGVNAGVVKDIGVNYVVLEDCRRLHGHAPNDKNLSWYEGVAQVGLSDDSRVSSPATKLIVEVYSLTLCSEKAEKNIRNFKPRRTNNGRVL